MRAPSPGVMGLGGASPSHSEDVTGSNWEHHTLPGELRSHFTCEGWGISPAGLKSCFHFSEKPVGLRLGPSSLRPWPSTAAWPPSPGLRPPQMPECQGSLGGLRTSQVLLVVGAPFSLPFPGIGHQTLSTEGGPADTPINQDPSPRGLQPRALPGDRGEAVWLICREANPG